MELHKVLDENAEDMDAVQTFCDQIYANWFYPYFSEVRQLASKLNDTRKPISDSDLESVLTYLPLQLFLVSENLNKLRLDCQVTKLKAKEKKNNTATSQTSSDCASSLEYDVMLAAYSSIINRVEHEISFSRELIMSAKKIYDGRRATEQVNPVKEIDTSENLPDYSKFATSSGNSNAHKTYITGS